MRRRLWLALLASVLCSCNNNGETIPEEPEPTEDASVTEDGPAAPADGPIAGREKPRDRGSGTVTPSKWIPLTTGTFQMGSPANELCRDADEDQHEVKLTHKIEIAETEVTQKQFESLMGYNPSFHTTCGATCPVEFVSWHEAVAYCNALSRAGGRPECYSCTGSGPHAACAVAQTFAGENGIYGCPGYRLPTEAEWEHAARAGTTTAFYVGGISSCMSTDGNAGKIAWYKVNSTGLAHPVAGKTANAWGLFDMAGSVYEWVNDWYAASLGSGSVTDPAGPANGTARVFRGGAYYFNAEHARSANRLSFSPTKRFTFLGFRCVRSL
jgi:formylglycine-generating enzyme required for sulfatase activity